MSAQVSAYGRLVADPQIRTTTTGKHMAMARLSVALPCRTAQNGEATFWLGVVAFGNQAAALAKHVKGDMISIAGNMQLNQWAAQDGAQKEQPQVIADSVISARTTRPGGRKKASYQESPPATGAAPGWDTHNPPDGFDQRPPFDDDF
ncbi:single-stranded DNA-binding protein [Pantoea sp. 1.19]|uniref:single-stranded DNA-binding protein n=1 Tax=Pantoea sp. 1.19 TaxID=1925589 RepID=UPI00094893D1|nr:single-stranded DNA-binding protein [Pantoea sp. 1.19]